MARSRRTCGGVALVMALAALSPPSLEAELVAGTHRHRGTATIDGFEGEGEWAGALVGFFPVDLPQYFHTQPFQIPFYVMNDDDRLYVAARIAYDESPDYPYFLYFEVGAWQGELSCAGFDIPDQFVLFSVDNVVTVRDEHLLICEDAYWDVWTATGTLDSEGSWSIADGSTFFEMSQPLDSADDLHDLNATAPGIVSLSLVAGGGNDTNFDFGVASAVVDVFLMTADTLLYADFEGGDLGEWTSAEE